MILLITNKEDITIDYVVRELQKRKLPYYRLNTEDIPYIVAVDFDFEKDEFFLHDRKKCLFIKLSDVSAVYFRRPGITSLNFVKASLDEIEHNYLQRETAQILEGIYKILDDKYWINNVYRIREAENKIHQLRLAKEVGFSIPKTILSNNTESVDSFYNQTKGDCIIKPVRSGGMGRNAEKVVFTSKLESIPDGEQVKEFDSSGIGVSL